MMLTTLCLSSPSHAKPLLVHNKHLLLSLKTHQPSSYHTRQQCHHQKTSFLGFNHLRVSVDSRGFTKRKRHGYGAVCFSGPLTVKQLQWASTVCTAILMLVRGTAVHKSFLVPLFALQAPPTIISWIKGEYGIWSAFLALLVRLFFFIPGELELPFMALLLVIVAPYQVMNIRGKQEGAILSSIIAAYLAFQHFSRAGSLQKAFDRGSIIASLAIILNVAVQFLLWM